MKFEMPKLALLIDDDEGEFVQGLVKRSKDKYGLTLKHCTNLEDGREVFEKLGGEHTFVGVILDFECKLTRHQEIPDKKFFIEAKSYFDLKAPTIPKMYLTAHAGHMREITENVYLKEFNEVSTMLECLKKHGESNQFSRIRTKYNDVFEVFENNLLPRDMEKQLFGWVECSDPSSSVEFAGVIRSCTEDIFRNLLRRHPSIISQSTASNDIKPKVIVRGLKDAGIIKDNSLIFESVYYVYATSSDIVHKRYIPSKYTMQALVYSLFDIILWYKSMVRRTTSN